jgi:[ribosomal protein S5]-alanine N-acetyltransferase
MSSLNPIILNNGTLELHPLRNADVDYIDQIEFDLFEILSDPIATKYIEEKRISKREDAINVISNAFLGYQTDTGYMHFLTIKSPRKTIGVINLITPKRIEMEYGLRDTWFIEYYLNKKFWRNNLMGNAVASTMQEMEKQGIKKLGALCFKENTGSIVLLRNMGFDEVDLTKRGFQSPRSPKYTQAYYEITLGDQGL